ncbi:TPA: 2-oxoacid:ferredoxin oxidoreductase subunit beta [Candidatus Woesearchaeota archaeon]|nr:2-oxoacid:ferredoxin oxidoreductase subunit beta [Candidatus Woesearchaeota archaeon]
MKTTGAENTWCPGCGNFGILTAMNKAVEKLAEKGVLQEELVMVTGIGCHGKIFDYLGLNGFYGLHGRAVPLAEGIKLGNPRLKVIVFSGDGDSWGEGLAHTLFAAKRNIDITHICHNNGVYALTTGQSTPLSKKGFKGKSTPKGNPEEPFNPLRLIAEAGAGFIARGYCMKIDHLADLIVKAVMHKGYSYVDVLQVCKTYNDLYAVYNKSVEAFDDVPDSESALKMMVPDGKVPIGIFREQDKEIFTSALGGKNPVEQHKKRDERLSSIRKILG